MRYDARTGATLERLPLSSAFTDINHFQMLENQTEQFVINGRVTNNFAMVSHTDSELDRAGSAAATAATSRSPT